MSFFKQGNTKALKFIARQLKMKPKTMMNEAYSISSKTPKPYSKAHIRRANKTASDHFDATGQEIDPIYG